VAGVLSLYAGRDRFLDDRAPGASTPRRSPRSLAGSLPAARSRSRKPVWDVGTLNTGGPGSRNSSTPGHPWVPGAGRPPHPGLSVADLPLGPPVEDHSNPPPPPPPLGDGLALEVRAEGPNLHHRPRLSPLPADRVAESPAPATSAEVVWTVGPLVRPLPFCGPGALPPAPQRSSSPASFGPGRRGWCTCGPGGAPPLPGAPPKSRDIPFGCVGIAGRIGARRSRPPFFLAAAARKLGGDSRDSGPDGSGGGDSGNDSF